MICSLPNSSLLPLLATTVCVAFGLTLVAGHPVTTTTEAPEYIHRCSTDLAEIINTICNGRTRSLAQLYPQSFGQHRTKRSSPAETFFRPQSGPTHRCCQRPCGYDEIRLYCAPD